MNKLYTVAATGDKKVTIFDAETGRTINTISAGGTINGGVVVIGDRFSVPIINSNGHRQLRFFKLPSGANVGVRDL